MQPQRGSVLYSVPGISGVAIAGGSDSPEVSFFWPRDLFVSGVLLLSDDGSPVTAAGLSLRVVDESTEDVIADGQGAGFFAPALSLQGFGVRPYPLQRPVTARAEWLITVRNDNAGPVAPQLLFFFEEP